MKASDASAPPQFRYAVADSISFLNSDDWDRVTSQAGVFLSRPFLQLLEQHVPEDLSVHYAIVYSGSRPVASVVAQSLEVRVADLSSADLPRITPGLWHSLEAASQRSIKRARKRFLLYDSLLLWPYRDETVPEAAPGESWPDLAAGIWQRLRYLLKAAERVAELPVASAHLRFLVCGNLLSTGPHGVAFAEGEEPETLWPAAVEALYRIRRSSTLFGESDMVLIKDLTDDQCGAGAALRRLGFRRFETEPNMLLQLKSSWASFNDCLDDMKSAYRSRIKKTLKELDDAGVVLKRLSPKEVQAEAGEIYGLYHQVHDRQKLRLVTIREGWIPALAARYREDFRTVVARPRGGGRILGFITLIRDKDGAFGYYVGFDKASAAKGLPLYVSLVYAGVGQAIEMGASRVTLGRTALGPKAQIGSKAQGMYGYLRHRSRSLNLAVPSVLALLPEPAQAPERHPFKA